MHELLGVLIEWMYGRRAYHKTLYALLNLLTGDRHLWYPCVEAFLSCVEPGSRLSLARNSTYHTLLVCRIDIHDGCLWATPMKDAKPRRRRPMTHRGIDVYGSETRYYHRPAVELVKIRLWSAFRSHLITQWAPAVWDTNTQATFSYLAVSPLDFPTTEGWYRNQGPGESHINKYGIILYATAEIVCLPWALCKQSLKIGRDGDDDDEEEEGEEEEEPGEGATLAKSRHDLTGSLPYYVEEVVRQAFLPGACLATGAHEGSHTASILTATASAAAKKKRRRMTPQERREAEQKKRSAELRERLLRESRGKSATQESDLQSALCASSVGRQRICVYNGRDAPVRMPDDAFLLWAAVGMGHRTDRMSQLGSSQVVVTDPASLGREMQVVPHPGLLCPEASVRPVCDLYYDDPERSYHEADAEAGPVPADIPQFRVFFYGKRVYTIDMYFPTLRRYRLSTDEGGAVLAHKLLIDRWTYPFITYDKALEATLEPRRTLGHVCEEVPCYRWRAYDPDVEPMDIVMERGKVA